MDNPFMIGLLVMFGLLAAIIVYGLRILWRWMLRLLSRFVNSFDDQLVTYALLALVRTAHGQPLITRGWTRDPS